MTDTRLEDRHCQNLPAGTPKINAAQAKHLLMQVVAWQLNEDGNSIRRSLEFADFGSAIEFINRVADLAEAEQHHPDIRLHAYRRVTLEFSTHSIHGLSENDFIMAAKTNRAFDSPVRIRP